MPTASDALDASLARIVNNSTLSETHMTLTGEALRKRDYHGTTVTFGRLGSPVVAGTVFIIIADAQLEEGCSVRFSCGFSCKMHFCKSIQALKRISALDAYENHLITLL